MSELCHPSCPWAVLDFCYFQPHWCLKAPVKLSQEISRMRGARPASPSAPPSLRLRPPFSSPLEVTLRLQFLTRLSNHYLSFRGAFFFLKITFNCIPHIPFCSIFFWILPQNLFSLWFFGNSSCCSIFFTWKYAQIILLILTLQEETFLISFHFFKPFFLHLHHQVLWKGVVYSWLLFPHFRFLFQPSDYVFCPQHDIKISLKARDLQATK